MNCLIPSPRPPRPFLVRTLDPLRFSPGYATEMHICICATTKGGSSPLRAYLETPCRWGLPSREAVSAVILPTTFSASLVLSGNVLGGTQSSFQNPEVLERPSSWRGAEEVLNRSWRGPGEVLGRSSRCAVRHSHCSSSGRVISRRERALIAPAPIGRSAKQRGEAPP